MNRQALRLPTAFLLDAEGRVVKTYRDRVDVSEILRDARGSRPRRRSVSRERRAFRGNVLVLAGPAQLPSLRPGVARSGPRGSGDLGLRAGGAGEPERIDPLPPGDPPREERAAGQGEGGLRAGARDAAGPLRGQQRPRRAPGAGRGPPGGHRALPRRPRGDPRLPRRAQQPGLRPSPDGPAGGGPGALREGPEAPARFPRGPEQPRPDPGAAKATWTARSPTSGRRSPSGPTTGRRPTTWPWCS